MQIISTLSVDLCRQEPSQRIRVMQADANTRSVEICLLKEGTAWIIPEGITAVMGYRKPDGTAGLYDKLPDGTDALSMAENRVTVVLAPQVLTVPGLVMAVITFYDADLNQLSTFPFEIIVCKNPMADNIVSENYCCYTSLDAISRAIGDVSKLYVGTDVVTAINTLADNGGMIPGNVQEIVNLVLNALPVYRGEVESV